jgi:hypothetical protein
VLTADLSQLTAQLNHITFEPDNFNRTRLSSFISPSVLSPWLMIARLEMHSSNVRKYLIIKCPACNISHEYLHIICYHWMTLKIGHVFLISEKGATKSVVKSSKGLWHQDAQEFDADMVNYSGLFLSPILSSSCGNKSSWTEDRNSPESLLKVVNRSEWDGKFHNGY